MYSCIFDKFAHIYHHNYESGRKINCLYLVGALTINILKAEKLFE